MRGKSYNTPGKLFWVGVGASAEGLEALRAFVAGLERHKRLTYVIVYHGATQQQSLQSIVELLRCASALPVKEVRDGTAAQPNVIYVMPPDSIVTVEDSHLRLTPSAAAIAQSFVDAFFLSLAHACGRRAIGVILSGAGLDGALGMKAIRAAGGMTFAQDAASAKYHGMPQAAIDMGCVDSVFPPSRIGQELLSRIDSLRNSQAEPGESDEQRLLSLLSVSAGINFNSYRATTLRRCIERRMEARGTTELAAYLAFVRSSEEELTCLSRETLVSVTSFFRDKQPYLSLEKVIRSLMQSKKPQDKIRIWVVGAATGEEAYSIAMLCAEALGGVRKLCARPVQIFATDIDTEALAFARRGVYAKSSLKNVSPARKRAFFTPRGNQFELVKPLREAVLFARHNIVEDPPFLKMDLIACRNVLIYFNAEGQQSILRRMHRALSPQGHLFLGTAEAPPQGDPLFRSVVAKARIYRCAPQARADEPVVPSLSPRLAPARQMHAVQAAKPKRPKRKTGSSSIFGQENEPPPTTERLRGLETSNRKLRTSNKTLEAANRQLKIVNEELRAAKEELMTLNDALTGRIAEFEGTACARSQFLSAMSMG